MGAQSHDFSRKRVHFPPCLSQAYCNRISTLTFSFSFEKNYILKCFNSSTNNYSFEESILALRSILCVKEEEREHKNAHFGDVARLYHSYHTFNIFVESGRCPRVVCSFKSEKPKGKVYMCMEKISMIQIKARTFFKTFAFGCTLNFGFASLYLGCLVDDF